MSLISARLDNDWPGKEEFIRVSSIIFSLSTKARRRRQAVGLASVEFVSLKDDSSSGSYVDGISTPAIYSL